MFAQCIKLLLPAEYLQYSDRGVLFVTANSGAT